MTELATLSAKDIWDEAPQLFYEKAGKDQFVWDFVDRIFVRLSIDTEAKAYDVLDMVCDDVPRVEFSFAYATHESDVYTILQYVIANALWGWLFEEEDIPASIAHDATAVLNRFARELDVFNRFERSEHNVNA